MPFAQLVIGPPGSGKSTYCDGMHQFLSAIKRKCAVVNLDPANDHVSYPCALDIRDLVPLEDVMEHEQLGPNGGVLYALEELEENWEWFEEGLKDLQGAQCSIICPKYSCLTCNQTLTFSSTALARSNSSLITIPCLEYFIA